MPAKAIRTDSYNNRTTGFAAPPDGSHGLVPPSDAVHDGDTVNVRLNGNLGVRLLGIDTPEVSFQFPGGGFVSLDSPQWEELLSEPLADKWGEFPEPMPAAMAARVSTATGSGAAADHHYHAEQAGADFRRLIEGDMQVMQQDLDEFGYYMNFGFEVMDRYGRLLCMLNRNQPERTVPTPRPPSYNLRLLERGRAFPYFIWPNVNPWDRPENPEDAVIPPGGAKEMAQNDRELESARNAVRKARSQHLGLFDRMRPLLLEPFELRFLARRSFPSRFLIDLNSDSDVLLHPKNYPQVAATEDRLWIPRVYVPLFAAAGWKVQDAPA